jgi:hypothetical protein
MAIPAAAATPERPQVKFVPADVAAARAASLRASDLPAGSWDASAVKPDLSGAPSCANFHPKQADLVITGAAAKRFLRVSGLVVVSQTELLRSARMVRLDWERTIVPAPAVACQRQAVLRGFGTGARLLSFGKLPFPKLAARTARFRAVASIPIGNGKRTKLALDVIVIGTGRAELTLDLLGSAAAEGVLARSGPKLARAMLGRL